MRTCQNCYNSFICMQRNKAKYEKYKELDEGCINWEDDQLDYDNDFKDDEE